MRAEEAAGEVLPDNLESTLPSLARFEIIDLIAAHVGSPAASLSSRCRRS